MDWAEELKLSLKKTTRKGRRSKSRDILKEKPAKNSSSTSSAISSPKAQKTKEISIDITLDLQQSDSVGAASTATPHKPFALSDESKRPVRISGWAENGLNVLKSSKSRRAVSYEDDRFQQSIPSINSATSSPPEDDIPVIPDLDDLRDDTKSSEIETSPLEKRTPKEYNSDLLAQTAFKALGDLNLFVLTRSLHPPEHLDEADEVWEWEKAFTDVVAEINSDKSQKIAIRPDEVPPAMQS